MSQSYFGTGGNPEHQLPPLGPIPYLPPLYYCPFGGHRHPPNPCPYCYPVQSPN